MIFVVGFLMVAAVSGLASLTPTGRSIYAPPIMATVFILGCVLMLGSLLTAAWRHLP